jgi:hypothetical protein
VCKNDGLIQVKIQEPRRAVDIVNGGAKAQNGALEAVLWIRIRIRSDPELFEGSGSGSGINSFGSGSFLIPNFCVKKSHFFNQIAQKIGNFSTYIYVHIKYVFIYM